jgi:vacuolar-type H+-ATPase subunit I/STV1
MPLRRALAGVVFGAAIGVLLLVFQVVGLLVVAAALVWSSSVPSRGLAVGSLLLGAGACWLVLIALHIANPCGETATTTCTSPDLLPFSLAAIGALLAGCVLVLRGLRTVAAE